MSPFLSDFESFTLLVLGNKLVESLFLVMDSFKSFGPLLSLDNPARIFPAPGGRNPEIGQQLLEALEPFFAGHLLIIHLLLLSLHLG